MELKKFAVLALAALMIVTFAACSNNAEGQSEPESSSESSQPEESSDTQASKTPEEFAEEIGYMTLEEITAAGYYPDWMQPHTYIVYDENCVPEIIAGGELTIEDAMNMEEFPTMDFCQFDDEMKIEPNTKAEYDLHGFIQNIYHLWPDGSYNLDYPPENLQSNG